MLSGILSSPFATAYPPLLRAAAATLQTVTLNDWPRIGEYRGELMKAIGLCWCRIEDDDRAPEQLAAVKGSLQDLLKSLRAVLASEPAAIDEADSFLRSDDRLAGLTNA
jgi:tRNA nucleotidyltransferase (CCA-adding enzyme)